METKTQTAEDNQKWAADALRHYLGDGMLALILRGGTDNPNLTTVSVMLMHDAGGLPTNITHTVSQAIEFDDSYAVIVPGREESVLTFNDDAEAVRHILETAIQTATGIERVSARWL